MHLFDAFPTQFASAKRTFICELLHMRYRVSDISYANRLCEADFISDLLLEKEENFMLTMKKADYEKISAHAKENLPEEACGLIAGTKDGDKKIIEKVYLLENVDHTNEHFSMNPKDQLAAVKDMRANGLVPLGNWHSHPESPSRPSEEDKRLAYDPTVNYLILSLMDMDQPVLKAFDIDKEKNVMIEELVIL